MQHENIIKVHELIIDKLLGAIYLVMELFEGKEMFELLSEIGYYNGIVTRKSGQILVQEVDRRNPVPAQTRGRPQRPEAQ